MPKPMPGPEIPEPPGPIIPSPNTPDIQPLRPPDIPTPPKPDIPVTPYPVHPEPGPTPAPTWTADADGLIPAEIELVLLSNAAILRGSSAATFRAANASFMEAIMTPQAKANEALLLLKEAVMDVLTGSPSGMQPSEVREKLGLKQPESATGEITYAVMTLMVDAGELERGDGVRPAYRMKKSTQQ